MTTFRAVLLSVAAVCLLMLAGAAQEKKPESLPLIQPAELAQILRSSSADKPLVLHVGFHMLYAGRHIPGAEYAGPASDPQGLDALRTRLKGVPHSRSIVLYCGCCPWDHCPNIHPAYAALRNMGFKQVKVLYLADNFRSNWIDKGYPTEAGH